MFINLAKISWRDKEGLPIDVLMNGQCVYVKTLREGNDIAFFKNCFSLRVHEGCYHP